MSEKERPGQGHTITAVHWAPQGSEKVARNVHASSAGRGRGPWLTPRGKPTPHYIPS
jgi:hypothetical protein